MFMDVRTLGLERWLLWQDFAHFGKIFKKGELYLFEAYILLTLGTN
jgi:hypothetical protein